MTMALFFYFFLSTSYGKSAPLVPTSVMEELYDKTRGRRSFWHTRIKHKSTLTAMAKRGEPSAAVGHLR